MTTITTEIKNIENSLKTLHESGIEIDLLKVLVDELNQGLVNDICNAV